MNFMAIHRNLTDLSAEAIDQYIELARLGLESENSERNCLGYPSTLLLFCVIDALSNHLDYPEHSFGALSHQIFGMRLTAAEIKRLKVFYRNPLAHNGMIAPGTILTNEAEGDAIETANGEPIKIRTKALLRSVQNAWSAFDKDRLKPRRLPVPLTPSPIGLLSSVIGTSGCSVPSEMLKKR
jgi:hypothetical protein